MKTPIKVALALCGIVTAFLASLPIQTYSQIRDAREFVSRISMADELKAEYGKFSDQISEAEQLAVWKKRYRLDVRDGDTLLIKNREGFPYWIIVIVTPDLSSIRDRYVGYYK